VIKTKRAKPKRPDLIDIHIGQNIRWHRRMRGLSQEHLASNLNVTYQQLQKYELGVNRVSASRLYSLAKALNVAVGDFYRGLENKNKEDRAATAVLYDLDRESIEMLALYRRIPDKDVRRLLIRILKIYTKEP
jgi:transcriptional regulator with XRE-family HTH domain